MRIVSRLLVTCAAVIAALATAAVSPPGAVAASSTCTAVYSIGNNWAGGFQAGVTITNNGPAIANWTLASPTSRPTRTTTWSPPGIPTISTPAPRCPAGPARSRRSPPWFR